MPQQALLSACNCYPSVMPSRTALGMHGQYTWAATMLGLLYKCTLTCALCGGPSLLQSVYYLFACLHGTVSCEQLKQWFPTLAKTRQGFKLTSSDQAGQCYLLKSLPPGRPGPWQCFLASMLVIKAASVPGRCTCTCALGQCAALRAKLCSYAW